MTKDRREDEELDTEYLPNCEQENLPLDEPLLLLGIDFETTGLDLEKDKIIEAGLVLYDWNRKTPLYLKNYLINWEVPIPNEISKLTGIKQSDIELFGKTPCHVFDKIKGLMNIAKFIVAYNGNEFDRPLLINNAKEFNLDFSDRNWLDLITDIDYPEHIEARKLEFIAAQHGFLNPFSHRALFDVLTMFKVMSNYDLWKILANAQVPMINIRACVSYDDREKAKAAKFFWDGPRKIWTKKVKENKYPKEEEKAKELGFPIVRLT